MNKKVAIIDTKPSKVKYDKYFTFEYDLYHLVDSSVNKKRILKKDITLNIDYDNYDLIILVGSDAAKHCAKITSVTNLAGHLVDDKFVAITNPAILYFKPEGKNDFERSVQSVIDIYNDEYILEKDLDIKGILCEKEAQEFLEEVLNNAIDIVTLDTETSALYPRDGYILGLSICYKEKQARYIHSDALNDICLFLLQKIIDKYVSSFHNSKFDIKMTQYHYGIKFNWDKVDDTMLMHYVLDENSPHGLKPLALKYTKYGDYDKELDTFKKSFCKANGIKEEDFSYEYIPFETMWPYACKDTLVTFELHKRFKPIIDKSEKFSYVYKELLIKGSEFLAQVEEVGVPINSDRVQLADEYLSQKLHKLNSSLYTFEEVRKYEKAKNDIFNPNSPTQLRELLFDYIGLDPTGIKTKTSGKDSTDAEALELLSSKHPIASILSEIRKNTKLKTSYTEKILKSLDRDGFIRTNFNLHITTSGRLSSSGKFNAQQMPRDNPIIKGCIVAPDGYKIVSQDLQTGEVYYAAVLSGDVALQNIFRSKEADLHSTIAHAVFSLDCHVTEVKEKYPALRQAAKAITFGILYGASAKKVADTVSKELKKPYPIGKAEENIRDYFNTFSRLKEWLEETKARLGHHGYTYSFFGRKRRLPNVFSKDRGIVGHEIRSGLNSEIQSVCSDVNLLGAMDTQNELNDRNIDAKIFMLVHDSIVALVNENFVDGYCAIVKRNTQKDRGCSIVGAPIGVDQEIGDDYSFGKFDKKYKVIENSLSYISDAEEAA